MTEISIFATINVKEKIMREEINGMIFINGILCDGAGRPMTVRNGYSSEDEEAAIEAYNEAKKNYTVSYSQNYIKPQKKSKETKSTKPTYKRKKYRDKIVLDDDVLYKVTIDDELIIPKYRNETLCNEAGEEISIENGYSEEDAEYAKNAFKEFYKTLNQ